MSDADEAIFGARAHAVSAFNAVLALMAVTDLTPDQRQRIAAAYLEFQDRFRASAAELPIPESFFSEMQAADDLVLQTLGVSRD